MSTIAHRTIEIDRARAKDENRTVTASISSEKPVERGWGNEILLHDKDAIDLHRVPLPLLVNHNAQETPVGVAENVRLDGKRLVADFRFGKTARAAEMWNDIKDGVLRHVSVGYRIKDAKQKGENILVNSWELLEVSLVSVPADSSVGIGRALDLNQKGKRIMEGIEIQEGRANIEQERLRNAEILAISRTFSRQIPDLDNIASQAIEQGWKVERFRKLILDKMRDNGGVAPLPEPVGFCETGASGLGMSRRELEGYSVIRAINAAVSNDWSMAGLEREVSGALARKMGRRTTGVVVPFEALGRSLSKGVAAAGGDLVGTDHLGNLFVELLRSRARTMELGARVLSGLHGDVEIPRQTGAATAYWVAEDEAVTPSDLSVDKLTLQPKTLGALTSMSRKLLLQASPDAEVLVRNDLAAILAIEIDRAAIAGSGINNQPRGILNTTGIGSVVCGDPDGAAPEYQDILNLVAAVADDNAERGGLGFLTNSKVRAKLMRAEKSTGTGLFVWEPGKNGDGVMVGYRALMSNNVPNNLTKGGGTNLSAILYGNWNDLVVGFWGGGVEIQADPYGSNFAKGAVSIRALVDCDVAVRNASSFAAIQDALTA